MFYFVAKRCLTKLIELKGCSIFLKIIFQAWLSILVCFFLFSTFGGFRETARNLGLGENVTFKLARLEKTRGQSNCFAINTDFQADLEMKSIRDGTDTLQSK